MFVQMGSNYSSPYKGGGKMHSSSGSPFHFLHHVLEHLKWVNLMVAPISSSLTVVTMVATARSSEPLAV